MIIWQSKTLDVDGVRAHYLEAGEGDTIVLVHGALVWCSAELTYGSIIEPLSRRFNVVAVDVIGYGETPGRGPEDFSSVAQGDFLVKFLRRLDRRAHVAGNSHGGWLVQYMAHEAPDLVRKVVIINSLNGTSPIPADYPLPRDVEQTIDEAYVRKDLLSFYVDPKLVTDARVGRTLALSLRNYDFALARRKWTGPLPADWNRNLLYKGKHISEFAGALNRPVLLTWSRENRGASPEDALRFYRRLRDGEVHVWSHAGHHVHTEHPESWSYVVGEFLARGEARP
ncbi:MAG: alpha/beta hydrolase [Armatimonadetes bacterium]|nr:alpha/beta hydrolase [Armatimonadota bacterium]